MKSLIKLSLQLFKIALQVSAILVSWHFNKSILWAIFHFFCGWFYLLYRLISGSFTNGGFMEIINSYF
jgi:hypothetical protein